MSLSLSNVQALTRPANQRVAHTGTVDARAPFSLIALPYGHMKDRMSEEPVARLIERKLHAAFADAQVEVEDESRHHEGHAGHRPGGQTHFRVYIVSTAFEGKTRLERHRMINSLLAEELSGRVHALAIHASAPNELKTS